MEKTPAAADRRRLSDSLKDTTNNKPSLSDLPRAYAEVVRSRVSRLDTDKRKEALGIIRDWVAYVEKHNVSDADPFLIRYHLTNFAQESFGKERASIALQEVDLGSVSENGNPYEEVIAPFVSRDIVHDRNVAIIGGTARIALKMYARMSIRDELPINDVDMVVSTDADIPATAHKYGVDLSGAKIIDGAVKEALSGLITNFDCTMNQVAVHDGKLFFPDRALRDIKEGNIRLIAKDDPLFGSEGVALPDGNIYLNRNGFYRGLSFLLRGKGQHLIVSKENIEREKDNIGRYWLVMLFVKIMPMKDEKAKKNAIAHWHEIAHRIGSTTAEDPESFFKELMGKYPETRAYSRAGNAFDTDAQVRWLIGKLTGKAVDELYGEEETELPSTYTEANLELSDTVGAYDVDSFMRAVKDSSEGNAKG